MRRLIWILAVGVAWAGEGRRIANYEITARLDPSRHVVEGQETLTWLNDSKVGVGELRFHLYMNAFRDSLSTFQREARRELKPNEIGSIEVKRLRVADGADLTPLMKFVRPDDGNTDDRTVMAVALPEPVKPGGTITLEIEFTTKLPRVTERTGYHGDFYMVAQWFPKIGVWEKAGRWNCHQFHYTSEFFADFGRYAVTLTVPADYVVGATGVMESRRDDAKTRTATCRFVQDDVHDFAWTASPRFVRVERMIGPVKTVLLIQPEHTSQIERHFRAVSAGLDYFGMWYGPYPYKTLTVVDPPFGGHGAGGMEYPTLFTAGTSWIAPAHGQDPETVIVHEFAHQYWYGLVASNEFEESWLDEGFATYSTSKLLDKVYGPQTLGPLGLGFWLRGPEVDWDGACRIGYLPRAKLDSLLRNSWEYYSGSSYGANSYARPALVLRTLENLLGQDTMGRVMRTYFERWRYRHPTTRDFIQVAEEVSARKLDWFFDQFVYGSNVVDYKVGGLETREAPGKKGQFESVVKIQREGEAIVPVEFRVRFDDGAVAERQWDGQYRWVKYTFTRAARVRSVEIDPQRKILLDVNFANNGYVAKLAERPLLKWAQNLLFWAQNLLLIAGGVS